MVISFGEFIRKYGLEQVRGGGGFESVHELAFGVSFFFCLHRSVSTLLRSAGITYSACGIALAILSTTTFRHTRTYEVVALYLKRLKSTEARREDFVYRVVWAA